MDQDQKNSFNVVAREVAEAPTDPKSTIAPTRNNPFINNLKNNWKKIFAGGIGLIILLIGVFTAVALVQRAQDIRKEAAEEELVAQCTDTKIFNTDWTQLTETEIVNLQSGDVVYITVSGTAVSGSIDMARFTVNGAASGDITQKRPGTDDFYYEYTIPSDATGLNVSAQLHHSVYGWF